jgi:hypothetical protein
MIPPLKPDFLEIYILIVSEVNPPPPPDPLSYYINKGAIFVTI